MDRNKIVKFCEEYLKVKNFTDFCINGLQVEGKKEVNKIITGVSWSKKLIEVAIKKRAQMIMVHHGLFGDYVMADRISKLPQIKGVGRGRLKLLLEHDINLCGFHLPLDAHPVIGNNISLCKLLGVAKAVAVDIGFVGELKQAMNLKDFIDMVNAKLTINSYVIAAGPKKVKKVGIISGGSGSDYDKAVELGADIYITGEIRESIVRAVEEAKINFINAGHYNTEKLGIQNLGNLVAKKFRVKVEFVDVPNEV